MPVVLAPNPKPVKGSRLDLCRVSVCVFLSNVRVSMSVSLDTVSLRDLTGMTCLSVYFCASSVRVPMGTRSLACAGPTRPEMQCVHASDGCVLSAGDWLPATTRHLRRLSADQVLGSVWPLSCGTCMYICMHACVFVCDFSDASTHLVNSHLPTAREPHIHSPAHTRPQACSHKLHKCSLHSILNRFAVGATPRIYPFFLSLAERGNRENFSLNLSIFAWLWFCEHLQGSM